jgi:APA family basic amino acid/polyamine antiporter
MARDRLFFRSLAGLSESTRVPVIAIVVQAAWASILAMTGTYDQLTDCVVFAQWIFFALVASSLFVLRRKLPHATRAFRVPAYPVLPALFLLLSTWLVLTTLYTRPVESMVGLMLIASGFPLYFLFGAHSRSEFPKAINSAPSKAKDATDLHG